jgi:hypothetical protein
LPDRVRHFCFVQVFNDRCDFFNAIIYQCFSWHVCVPV